MPRELNSIIRPVCAGAMSLLAAAASGETLDVAKGTTTTLSSSVVETNTYEAVTVHGTLKVQEKITMRLSGATIDIAPTDGDEALWEMSGDPATTRVLASTDAIFNIGGATEGGTGKIVLTGVDTTVPLTDSYAYKAYGGASNPYGHLAARYQKLYVRAGAKANGRLSPESTENDVVDVLQINKGALVGIASCYNQNARPARILFNGGTFVYNNAWSGAGFVADANTRFILESVDGNPISFYNIYCPIPLNGSSSRVLETRGSGDFIVSCNGNTESYNIWTLRSGMVWNHSGDLVLKVCARLQLAGDNLLPYGEGRGNVVISTGESPSQVQKSAWINLNGWSHLVNGIDIIGSGGAISNSSTTASWLLFGTNDLNGTLHAPRLYGKIGVRKIGTGTLTITNTPSFESLSISNGVVRLAPRGLLTVKNLAIASGAVLELADAELVVTEGVENRGTIRYVRSGRLTVPENASVGACEKTGPGEMLLDDAQRPLTGLHVAEGSVKLVKQASSDNKFWRFVAKGNSGGSPFYVGSGLAFLDYSGLARADGAVNANWQWPTASLPPWTNQTFWVTGTNYRDAEPGTAAKDLQPGYVTTSAGWGWEFKVSGNYREPPSSLFGDYTYVSVVFTNGVPKLDKEDSWITFDMRLKDTARPVSFYRLRVNYDTLNRYVNSWEIWTSATGEDGSWVKADEQTNFTVPTSSTHYYGGDAKTWKAFGLTGLHAGATGLPAEQNVRVDRGATLDCTCVTDGQTLASLTVDCAAGEGDGTLRNVKLAATGTIDLLNYAGTSVTLPLVFDAASVTTGSLAGWTVTAAGEPTGCALAWRNGKLHVSQLGMMILFR